MNLRKITTEVLDISFRCHPCKVISVRRLTQEPSDLIDEQALGERAPRCTRCRKKMSYYWAAGWFKSPPGYKP